MNIFKTKYRVDREGRYAFYLYKKTWYSPVWWLVSIRDSLEEAKEFIAIEKSNPVWEE